MRPVRALGVGLGVVILAVLVWWAWHSRGFDQVINSPQPLADYGSNTLFTAFAGRSPRYLDPASSYSSDETPFTYNVYQPLYAYHYLKRPYELIPYGAEAVITPRYLDADGNELPADASGEIIAESVYDIPIRQGVRYAPHPAFARNEQGEFLYHALDADALGGIRGMADFEHTGTRELTAHDYVYQIRRMASPRIVAPIYSKMAEYIIGYREYGDQLREMNDAARAAGTEN